MEKQGCLIGSIHKFTEGSLKTLWEWLRLAGQLNWALNNYLWLMPGLGGISIKTAGRIHMWGRIQVNKMVQHDLAWFVVHIQWPSWLFLMVWWVDDVGHSMLIIYIDAFIQGIGIWFLSEKGATSVHWWSIVKPMPYIFLWSDNGVLCYPYIWMFPRSNMPIDCHR